MAGLTTMQIQVTKAIKGAIGNSTGLAGAYSSTFVGEDGYEYHINGNEVKTVPDYIGIPWLAADAALEQVGKYS